MVSTDATGDDRQMTDQLLDDLLARGADEWEALRPRDPLQWARDRRRCVLDTPNVADAPAALSRERADLVAEKMRLDAMEAHRQLRAQAKLWGRDHHRTDDAFERYDSALGKFYRVSSRA